MNMDSTNWVQTLRPEPFTLRDSTLVKIRPIRPDDAPRLQALAARLSPESIYLRFMTRRTTLLDEEAQRMASVDYQTQMALVATSENEENILAVARYTVLPAEPSVAEAGIIVEDAYHGKGLATALLLRLLDYARAHGIRSILAIFHQSNNAIMHLIQESGLLVESKKLEGGMWEVRVSLTRRVDVHRGKLSEIFMY
jgi:acetyltransferase